MAEKIGRLASLHRNGPGLKKLGKASDERWYGPGYCGICGDRTFIDADNPRRVVPVPVRYWDPDSGWGMSVLCVGCGEECTLRGPRPDDFACHVRDDNADHIGRMELQAMRIDALAQLTDLDGTYTETMRDDSAAGDI